MVLDIYCRHLLKTMNNKLIHDLTKEFKEARFRECNYYMADTLLASTAMEWLSKMLQGRLSQCLNVYEGYCDIWYMESHSECKLLMDMLYEITEDEIYNQI